MPAKHPKIFRVSRANRFSIAKLQFVVASDKGSTKVMREKILFMVCVCLLAAVPAIAQTRSVTNAELEKFRQKRVKAEQDYRENYARMGFPSPEELDRQLEKSRVEREELSTRLTAERLQREKAEAERAAYYQQIGSYDYLQYSQWFYTGYSNLIYYNGSFPIYRPRYNKYPVNIGNGFPLGNYGYPSVRPVTRWLRP